MKTERTKPKETKTNPQRLCSCGNPGQHCIPVMGPYGYCVPNEQGIHECWSCHDKRMGRKRP